MQAQKEKWDEEVKEREESAMEERVEQCKEGVKMLERRLMEGELEHKKRLKYCMIGSWDFANKTPCWRSRI